MKIPLAATDPGHRVAESAHATLAQLPDGTAGVVSGLTRVAGLSDEQSAALVARLRDLGFVAGAHCKVIARMWPGGDPLAVRVGGSTFALRRAEAAAVQLGP